MLVKKKELLNEMCNLLSISFNQCLSFPQSEAGISGKESKAAEVRLFAPMILNLILIAAERNGHKGCFFYHLMCQTE